MGLNLEDGRAYCTFVYLNILHNHCFQFLLGIKVVPIEIENNGQAIFFGGGGGWGAGRGNQGALWSMVYVKTLNKQKFTDVLLKPDLKLLQCHV